MKKIITKQQTFDNSILRASSQFEHVQIKTTLKNKIIDSNTTLVVHRVDFVSSEKRNRKRERKRKRS
jgi:hypothetical protein